MLRLALLCLLIAGCGRGNLEPASLEGEPSSSEPVTALDATPDDGHARVSQEPGAAPFLSRYGPTRGVIGTRVRVLGSFSDASEENVVTFGGLAATTTTEFGMLEAWVPPGAQTGPLCVTTHGQTTCGEIFTVLPGPVLYSVSPEPLYAPSPGATMQIFGDGFLEYSAVLLDGMPLETQLFTASSVIAQLPETLVPGEYRLTVKNGLRCGVESLPLMLTVH